ERQSRVKEQRDGGRADSLRRGQIGDPLAESPVPDLIVILKKANERCRRQVRARFSAHATTEPRVVTLVRESFCEAPPQWRERRLVVAIVAVVLPGENHMERVMEIVVPL